MARQETDREDLMREATALIERAEFAIPNEPASVIAGYRRDGSLSIYFGADPCVHFDRQLRLRRAYLDGDLYRTQGHTLAKLTRSRNDESVELRRHDLSAEELNSLLVHILGRLQSLHHALCADAVCLQVVPPQSDLRERLVASLENLIASPLCLAPAIRGKR